MAKAPARRNTTAMTDAAAILAERLKKQSSKTGTVGGNKVSLRGRQFNTPDGNSARQLVGVVIEFNSRNTYYPDAYDSDNVGPPACYAIADDPKDLAPADDAPDPQATSCAVCPQNEFGSRGKGKACRNHRRLAIIPPDAVSDEDVLYIDLPPTSVRNWDQYVQKLDRNKHLPVQLQTEMSMDESVDYPKISFRPIGENTLVAEHSGLFDTADSILSQGYDFSGVETTKRVPVRRKVTKRRST